MPTTTTVAGRVQLLHPDLGHDGGSALWNKIQTMFAKIGDSLSVQWFGPFTVAASGTQDVTHNFGMNLSELEVHIVESGVVISQEAQEYYGIAGKSGDVTNALTITNNNAGSKTFSVYVLGFSLDKLLGRQRARLQTTTATQATAMTIATVTDQAFVIDFNVVAYEIGTSDSNLYSLKVIADNNSGTVTTRIVSKLEDEQGSAWDVTCDVSGTDLRLRVTGEAAKQIIWYAVSQKTTF
jgi:hypothetical protein